MSEFDQNAREALTQGWGLSATLGQPRMGPRRMTWRVGDDLWLAGARGADADAIRREAELLVSAAPAAAEADIALPRVVPTQAGGAFFTAEDAAWRLCTHVEGEAVDPRRAEVWPGIAAFVARLDAVFATLPHSLAVRQEGGVVAAWAEHTRRFGDRGWKPASTLPDEGALLDRASRWIDSRIGVLTSLPVQLVHGDCHTPNLRIEAAESPRVRGAIDLELCAVDPVVVELASPAANLVIDSGLADPGERLRSLWQAWRRAGGDAPFDALQAALLLTRLRFYWLTRDQFSEDGGRVAICMELVARVLDVIGAREPGRPTRTPRPAGA